MQARLLANRPSLVKVTHLGKYVPSKAETSRLHCLPDFFMIALKYLVPYSAAFLVVIISILYNQIFFAEVTLSIDSPSGNFFELLLRISSIPHTKWCQTTKRRIPELGRL